MRRAVSWALCVVAEVALLGTVLTITTRRPVMQRMFTDLGGKLPALTEFMLAVPPWAVVTLGVVLVAFLLAKELLIGHQGVTIAINAVVFLLAMAAYVLFTEAMVAGLDLLSPAAGH